MRLKFFLAVIWILQSGFLHGVYQMMIIQLTPGNPNLQGIKENSST